MERLHSLYFLGLFLLICWASADEKVLEDYSLTLNNDAANSLTWLVLEHSAKDSKYFCFGTADSSVPEPSPGASQVNDALKSRTASQSYMQLLTQDEFTKISEAMDNFYTSHPLYQASPSGDNTYNGVTSCHKVLSAAQVEILKDVNDVDALKTQLENWKKSLIDCAGATASGTVNTGEVGPCDTHSPNALYF